MGAANGCTDVGGIIDTDTLDGITGNVTDGSYYVTPSASISGKLSPGDRIRIDGSHKVNGSLTRQLLRPSNVHDNVCRAFYGSGTDPRVCSGGFQYLAGRVW